MFNRNRKDEDYSPGRKRGGEAQSSRPSMNLRSALPLIIILAVVVIGVFLIGGEGDENATPFLDDGDDVEEPAPDLTGVSLGEVVIAENLDIDNCPTNVTDTISNATDNFHVVAEDSMVPEGTDVFVRLYYEDEAIEDLPEITADQDYSNACIAFTVSTADDVAVFNSGDYAAQFIVNGSAQDAVAFEIQ
jgi:hypothetical protein